MRFYQIRLLFVAAISFAAPATSLGITLGQINTFEDGTHQGWFAYPALAVIRRTVREAASIIISRLQLRPLGHLVK